MPLFGFSLVLGACSLLVEPDESRCGNGEIDSDFEECDGPDESGQMCRELGYYGGSISCGEDCRIRSTLGCEAAGRCGDGVVQAGEGEECDGLALGGQSCISLGFHDGTLACGADCRLDRSACEAMGRCGDGIRQENFEDCDGTELGSRTCLTQGYYGGALACNEACELDVSDCIGYGRCGDGELQAGVEDCDGADLGGATCVSLGYQGGSLTCRSTCRFDRSACCGDGSVGGSEDCDGSDFDGTTCSSLGYYGGNLACDSSCGLIMDACAAAGRCGDGTLQTAREVCDGALLNGATCVSQGYYGGSLACNSSCSGYLFTGCSGRCGDNQVQTTYGEVCDGTNLNGKTCATIGQGFGSGTLACNSSCGWNVANCSRCGNGTLDSGESCDGSNLNGKTCATLGLGFVGGSLSCTSTCTFNTSGCNLCGNGILDLGEECDGAELDGETCRSAGFFSGTLACDGNCHLDDSGCADIVGLATGSRHTCALLAGGTVRCWGKNDYGQVGDQSTTDRLRPVEVPGITGVTAISAGEEFTCVLVSGGSVKCWGRNDYGQIGDGVVGGSRLTPVTVTGVSGAVAIGLGKYHACAIVSGGAMKCWGKNQYGQVGDGTSGTGVNRPTAVSVSGLSGATQVDCGGGHTCARLSTGGVRCWGANMSGQVGDGTSGTDNIRTTPTTVTGVSDVTRVALGNAHSCAIEGNGTVKCWGENFDNQLGDGTIIDRPTPVTIITAAGIGAGYVHTCVFEVGGTMKCWGANGSGQIGNNTTYDRSVPTAVSNMTSAVAIDLGTSHTCALVTGGRMWCWGDNMYGQLGIGSTSDSRVPAEVQP